MPGILTGVILALSRAIGETAPLITIGALTYIAFLPHSVFDPSRFFRYRYSTGYRGRRKRSRQMPPPE